MFSLRWKLVALYAVILAAVIAAFSVTLTLGLKHTLITTTDTELEARAATVAAMVEYEDGKSAVEGNASFDAAFAADQGRYYLVFDPQGKLAASSSLARSLKLPTADGPADFWFSGRHFRQASISVSKRAEEEAEGKSVPHATLHIVCGKDLVSMDATLASLIRQLSIIGPLVLLLSLAGGLWLAGRALRPIDSIARTAAEINATDLSRRLQVHGRDELARLGKTLNEMFDRLHESFERQTRFTADASHELRTPLSIIAGNAELALRRPRSVDEYKDVMNDIREAASRMQSIVEGLLTLARADAKQLPLKREPVSLTPLVDEIVRMYRPLADPLGVAISIESTDNAMVFGDRDRLKELVSNLLTNAIRYNRPQGTIKIRIRREQERVELSVDDTGIGIPAEDLPYVFERFYRVDKARSRAIGGSGLGLAIAKWIVDAHAGTIRVSSKLGDGSSFVVSLPAVSA